MSEGHKHRVFIDQGQNDHTLERLRERLAAAAAAVRKRMSLHPSSRVSQWQHLLEALERADRRGVVMALVKSLQRGTWDHPFKAHLRALVECRSFIEIIEQLLDDISDSDLRDLVSGPLDPAAERVESRARDRDFELFVAAICRRSGLKVGLAEPDVLCTTARGIRAVAAKRLSSRKRVRENVSRAARQISGCGYPGFVFLDVTRLLEPRYEFIMHWRRSEDFLTGKLLAFERREYAHALAPKSDLVRGIVLRTAFPLLAEGLRLGTHETWHAVVPSDVDDLELRTFLHSYLRGLRGV